MKPAALFARAARALDRTRAGHRVGLSAYRAFARLAARRLLTVPDVRAVYLTGSLARGDADPGHSDIDLVVVADLDSPEAERALVERLARAQRRSTPLGGLFYNLDCLEALELPYARAFGGFWEMRLDTEGRALAGEALWSSPCPRPPEELAAERFSSALRRWVNTGARLLDPRVTMRPEERARDAARLAADVRAHAAESVREEAAGADAPPSTPVDAHLASAYATLDAFARHVSEPFSSGFRVEGARARFEPPLPLRAFAGGIVGGVVRGFAVLGRGAESSDVLPVLVLEDGGGPREALAELGARLAQERASLEALGAVTRRPVPLSPAMWRALALLEPAPFAGAAAGEPLLTHGDLPPLPPAPDPRTFEALLRARVVQSFAQCRAPALRGKQTPEYRERLFAERFALLGAVDRAVASGVLDVSFGGAPTTTPEERARVLHAFSERHRERLAPLLSERMGGATPRGPASR